MNCGRCACVPSGRFLLRVRPYCKSFDLGAVVVNTAAFAVRKFFRDAARTPKKQEQLGRRNRFYPAAERQDPMNETEKAREKPTSTEREAKRRERDKKLDKALEDSFPASDPISPSAPAPTRD